MKAGSILWMEYKRNLAYRSSALFSLLASVVSVLVQMALWKYLYQNNGERAAYMTSYVILSAALSVIYSIEIHNLISDKIAEGNFALELLKPVDFLTIHYMRYMGKIFNQLTFRVLPLLILFFPFLYGQVRAVSVLRAFPYILLGHVLYTALFMLSGLLSFVMVESWAVRRLMDNTITLLSGAVIPLAIFPGILQSIARLLPFQYLYDYPLRIMLGELSGGGEYSWGLFIEAVWALILAAAVYLVYRAVVRRCVV